MFKSKNKTIKTVSVHGKLNNKKIEKIQDVPLVSTNIKILKFLSLLIDNNWRQYYTTVPYIILSVVQLLRLFYDDDSPETKIGELYVVMLIINTNMRGFLMRNKRSKFTEFLEYLKDLYIELVEMQDLEIRQLLEECVTKAQKLTKMNLSSGSMTCVGFVLYPLLMTERVLFFNIYVPYIDVYQSPWYEIIYVTHAIMLPTGMCTFIPFTVLMVSCILFAITMCQVLKHKLRKLRDLPMGKVRGEIIWCIEYQLKFVRFIEHINSLGSILFLFEFMLFGGMMCVLLYSVIIVKTVVQMAIVSIYMFMIIAQGFLMYYIANDLQEESVEVAIAAYDTDWFIYDKEIQKMLQLLILRAQKPCAIRIGNVYFMNLPSLLALLKFTYSFYTLLQNLYA